MFRGQCKTACINDNNNINNNTQRQVIYRACLDQTTFPRHSSKPRATCSMSRATLTQNTLTPFFTQRLLSACVAFTDRNCLTFYPLTFLQACDSVIHVRPERTLIFVRCIFEHFGIVHTKRNNKKKNKVGRGVTARFLGALYCLLWKNWDRRDIDSSVVAWARACAGRPPIGRRGVGNEAHAAKYGERGPECAPGRACTRESSTSRSSRWLRTDLSLKKTRLNGRILTSTARVLYKNIYFRHKCL